MPIVTLLHVFKSAKSKSKSKSNVMRSHVSILIPTTNQQLRPSLRPCLQPRSVPLLFNPNAHPAQQTCCLPPQPEEEQVVILSSNSWSQINSRSRSSGGWVRPVNQETPAQRVPNTLTAGCLHPCTRALVQEWRQRDASSPWSSHGLMAL